MRRVFKHGRHQPAGIFVPETPNVQPKKSILRSSTPNGEANPATITSSLLGIDRTLTDSQDIFNSSSQTPSEDGLNHPDESTSNSSSINSEDKRKVCFADTAYRERMRRTHSAQSYYLLERTNSPQPLQNFGAYPKSYQPSPIAPRRKYLTDEIELVATSALEPPSPKPQRHDWISPSVRRRFSTLKRRVSKPQISNADLRSNSGSNMIDGLISTTARVYPEVVHTGLAESEEANTELSRIQISTDTNTWNGSTSQVRLHDERTEPLIPRPSRPKNLNSCTRQPSMGSIRDTRNRSRNLPNSPISLTSVDSFTPSGSPASVRRVNKDRTQLITPTPAQFRTTPVNADNNHDDNLDDTLTLMGSGEILGPKGKRNYSKIVPQTRMEHVTTIRTNYY